MPFQTANHGGIILQSIKKVNYVNEVYGQLNATIERGDWEEGKRIPSETALAKEMNVSRVVVREALQRLRAERKIVTRQGLGSFVSNPNNFIPAMNPEGLGTTRQEYVDFLAFRRSVERAAVCEAIQNRTQADLDVLAEDLAQMQENGRDSLEYTKADALFHYHIYCATHNPFFIKAYTAVSDMVLRCLYSSNLVADSYRFSRRFHVHLYEYIRDRKEAEAMKEMENHDNYNMIRYGELFQEEGPLEEENSTQEDTKG